MNSLFLEVVQLHEKSTLTVFISKDLIEKLKGNRDKQGIPISRQVELMLRNIDKVKFVRKSVDQFYEIVKGAEDNE